MLKISHLFYKTLNYCWIAAIAYWPEKILKTTCRNQDREHRLQSLQRKDVPAK